MRQELLGQTHGSERQTRHLLDLTPDRERELAAAAAEIDQEHPAGREPRAGHHAQVNEAAFLEPGDHLDLPARRRPHPVAERLRVLGLPHGARRDHADRGGAVALHGTMKALQRLDRPVHRLRLEQAGPEHRLAEPGNLAVLVDADDPCRARRAIFSRTELEPMSTAANVAIASDS